MPFEDEIDLAAVQRRRKRALMGTAGLVVGFLLLAYLGVSSSHTAPTTTHPSSPPSTATAAQPAATLAMPGTETHDDRPSTATAAQPAATAAMPSAPAGDTPAPTPATPAPAEPIAAAAPAAADTNVAPQPIGAPTPAPTPAPAPAPQLRLRVATDPRHAQLLLDDAPVANPLDLRLPPGLHRLRATADGHEAAARDISLEHDARISLVLTRVAPPPAPRPAARVEPAPRPAHHVAAALPPPRTVKPKASKGAGFVADSPY